MFSKFSTPSPFTVETYYRKVLEYVNSQYYSPYVLDVLKYSSIFWYLKRVTFLGILNERVEESKLETTL